MDTIISTYNCIDFILDSLYPTYRQENRSNLYKVFRSLESIIVFRVFNLLVEINYLKFIVGVIRKTLPSFLVVALLLFFTIIVYSLFGIQIFRGQFDTTSEDGSEKNFDDILSAVTSVLKICILDDSYKFIKLGSQNVGIFSSFLFVTSGKIF